MANLSLLELRKRIGRIEIFVGKLMRNDPFISRNQKSVYADSIMVVGSNGVVIDKFTPRTDYEATKLIQYIRSSASPSNQIYIYRLGDEVNKTLLSQLAITGEFGYKGVNYRDNLDTSEVISIRASLTKAIALNRGPIILTIGAIKYYDICDVVNSYSKNSNYKTKADVEFIDRYGNPVVWVATGDKNDSRDEQISQYIIRQSQQCQNFLFDIRKKYESGLESGIAVYRKFTAGSGDYDKLKAIYGPEYNGSKRYSAQNVNVVCHGRLSIVRGASNTFRLSASELKHNGEMVYGTREPVMMAFYSSGKNDFGIINGEVEVGSLGNKNFKEI